MHLKAPMALAACVVSSPAPQAAARDSVGLVKLLQTAAEHRDNALTAAEYDETTWAARNYMAFVAQRISVAAQISMAQEIAEALGLSVAADPRE